MDTEEQKDDEDELAALMIASTTVRKRKLEVGSSINPKRRKQLKDLAVLASFDNASQKEHEQNFAANYYNKLKEQLNEALFDKVVKILSNFDGTSEGVIELFKEISGMLPVSLAEEFLCFLTPSQAHLCGKFMDHLILSKIIEFFRKFEMSFAKQPQMVRKFYDILCQLASSENISLQQVKDAVLPLLKSKSFLTEYFLQLFPAERPPDSIVLDDFEEIYLDADSVSEEEIRLADVEESSNCPCSCHPSHPAHCQRCSVKYINGRVYIQAGKILRSARVEFNVVNPIEALRRVCVNSEDLTPKTKQGRRKPDILNQKDMSPMKHVSSPHMAVTESEDESLEVKANNVSTSKPKSARSLKLKFKPSEKITTKTKNSKIDEVVEEMRIISDENAISDTPDCFLANRLSPLEKTDNAVAGSLSFNNFLCENQNDASKQASLDSTLNFAVHSPLKKASICSDSFHSTSESLQSPIKLDKQLHIPLKRLEDDELMMTLNSKGISSSGSSDLPSEFMNSSYESSKTENRKLNSSLNSSISENIESIFTTSVVDEMNLLLGSSNVDKINSLIESSRSETTKNTQNGVEKYPEPTIDSLTIDSFLNISNLDAKIDAFLTNPEGTKNLHAFLNDASLENLNTDKDCSMNNTEIKEQPESYVLNGFKDSATSSQGVSEEKVDSVLLIQPEKSPIKLDRNMDSLLNFADADAPGTQITSSTGLFNFFEESSVKNPNLIKPSPNVKEEELEGVNEEQDSGILKNANDLPLPSLKNEQEFEIKEEVTEEDNDLIQGKNSALECDKHNSDRHMILNSPKLEEENIGLNVSSMMSVLESTTETFEKGKVECKTAEPTNSFPGCKVIPPALVACQENVTVIDSVQSVSFICGEEGGESGKVTLFSAEPIEDKMSQNSNIGIVSIPVEVAQIEFHDDQGLTNSLSANLNKMIGNSELSPRHSGVIQKNGKSVDIDSCSAPSNNMSQACKLAFSHSFCDPLKDIPVEEKPTPLIFPSCSSENAPEKEELMITDSCILKDAHESKKLMASHSSLGPIKDTYKREELMSLDFSASPSRGTNSKSEKLVTFDFSPSLSKDTKKIERLVASDSSVDHLKDFEKSELVSSGFSSGPSKNTQKSEKLVSANASTNLSKDDPKSEALVPSDVSPALSKDTCERGKLMGSNFSSCPSKVTKENEVLESTDYLFDSSKNSQKREDTKNEKWILSGSVSGPSKINQKSEKQLSMDWLPDSSKDTQNREMPVSPESSSIVSEDIKKEKLTSSDCLAASSKNVQMREKLSSTGSFSESSRPSSQRNEVPVSSESLSGPLKSTQKSEILSHSESRSAKDTQKSERRMSFNLSSGPLKDTPKKEKFVSSSTSSHLMKDVPKSEKSVSAKDQASEQVRPKDFTADLSVDLGNKSKDQGNNWTMEEDKIILETFQKDPDMQDIFAKIQTQLPDRSLLQVQSRFYVLIELLDKMSHSSDEANKEK